MKYLLNQAVFILLLLSALSCNNDYSKLIQGRWELVEIKHDEEIDRDWFNIAVPEMIEFNEYRCQSIFHELYSDSNVYVLKMPWEGDYLIRGNTLTLNNIVFYKIVVLSPTELRMDLTNSLEELIYNRHVLKKLQEKGVKDPIKAHCIFKRIM